MWVEKKWSTFGMGRSKKVRSKEMANEKATWWVWVLGAIMLAGALAIGGFCLGRSAGSADVRAAVARYDALRTADDRAIGTALDAVRSAIAESGRLAKSGSDIESTVRSIAVLVNGIRDCVGALEKAEAARSDSRVSGDPGSPK
jgi:hypothetical protein